MTEAILRAFSMAFAMGWEILWPLILGFALSAVVQAVVSHREMARLLPDDRPSFDSYLLSLSGRHPHHATMQPWRSPERCSGREPISRPPWPLKWPLPISSPN